MKRGVLWLVIGIPLAAVVMSSISIYFALRDPDPGVVLDGPPLTKTSSLGER
jgi:hypothetical protein